MPWFLLESATNGEPSVNPMGGLVQMLIFIVPLGLVFYFMILRPERKRKAQRAQMLNELIVGDEITTTGGIVGRVIQIKDDSVILETGADKTKIKLMRWAIASITPKEQA
ncbi:MAG: preprotein translocase subunit YajC [Oscillospiraceae bacterium]|nr:preprotein translocase subunit YajC [Oscillospiraceae bacterium]